VGSEAVLLGQVGREGVADAAVGEAGGLALHLFEAVAPPAYGDSGGTLAVGSLCHKVHDAANGPATPDVRRAPRYLNPLNCIGCK